MNEQTTPETIQPALFPLSAVQTEGRAQPEPATEVQADDDTEEDAA